jgi:amino acid transporter
MGKASSGEGITSGQKQYLGLPGAWALAFGCSVGWGSFVMPGTTFLPIAGPIGTAIGLFLGGLVMLLLAALVCLFRKAAAWTQVVLAVLLFMGVVICFVAASSRFGTGGYTPAYAPDRTAAGGVFTIFALAPWAFVGFESISHSAAEAKFSLKKSFVIPNIISINTLSTKSYLIIYSETGAVKVEASAENSSEPLGEEQLQKVLSARAKNGEDAVMMFAKSEPDKLYETMTRLIKERASEEVDKGADE